MRRPKISLKKYFYFTIICALLLIFLYNFKEREVWKPKSSSIPSLASSSNQQQQLQQQSQSQQQHLGQNLEDDYNDKYEEDEETEKPLNSAKTQTRLKASTTKTPQQQQQQHAVGIPAAEQQESESEHEPHLQQLQQPQANNLASNPADPVSKSWFFKNGEYYPKPAKVHKKKRGKKAHLQGSKLFPYQDPHNDRIVNQLMYVPPNYEEIKTSGKLKTILLYNGLGPWNVKAGRDVFLRSKCPVDTCSITASRDQANTADMILYKDHYIPTGIRRPANSKQVTMLYYLECPYHTQNVKVPDAINWTATYRRDSDIVAPYEKWVYYDSRVHQQEQDRNYAANKTKKVAWFVSNCGARNGRLQFAHELGKYIDVDIYGACGNYKCSRVNADKCFEMLDRDYKFYLAFENSNCKDYITEKFFVNALNRNILPIVMGARPEDYEVGAPERSYIHVDEFASASELADYLHILDNDEKLYNSYFNWKGTGEFINTYYWCRVCSSLHDEESLRKPRWYTDVNDWWRGAGVCTNGSWRNFKARKDIITDD
ncbi:LOW QUALITY PROTEIN: glycoprotein 3-alpha-L-fucosyltransferase A-like [Lucilia sericata]|uniref:LOW QUALITY PROTEIN: glycoprotein 3-alpha-L-fucosyltransferase A-like n=1 Tax=Lucilia sericata TaxID=13632 RepID=UPI0018A84156|nr:LOW QUALITY PROTEIN: glycoprotein 3-alpha-L-fucosyltransferase A-like [Lucilia sericata]